VLKLKYLKYPLCGFESSFWSSCGKTKYFMNPDILEIESATILADNPVLYIKANKLIRGWENKYDLGLIDTVS